MIASRIACIHYEYYQNQTDLVSEIESLRDQWQCIVSDQHIADLNTVLPGEAQYPEIDDYADHIDTLKLMTDLYD